MTLYVMKSIHCDWPECFGEDHDGLPGQRAPMVRSQARTAGWVRRNGQDFCPRHATGDDQP
jgi:hypothetical protein